MSAISLYGKFVSTADQKGWVDVTRAWSFEIQEKGIPETELKKFDLPAHTASKSAWFVYCNLEKASESIAIYATEEEARFETERLLISISAPASGFAQNQTRSGSAAMLLRPTVD